MSYRIRIFASVLLLILFVSAQAVAVDLRTNVGTREVTRTVTFQESPAAPAVEETTLVSAGEWIESDSALQSCDACGKAGCGLACLRWYGGMEYLLWWRRGSSFPPLVTTSPVGTTQPNAGVLGLSTTTILLGDEVVGEEARPGGRATVGFWLDEYQNSAAEGRFWILGEQTSLFDATSTDFPILARPFRDPIALTNGATLLAFPNFTGPGDISVTGQSRVLGGDALYRWCGAEIATARLDLLAGYQFSRIDEDLTVTSFTTAINVNNVAAGTTFDSIDTFNAHNTFHGGQIGMAVDWANCNWRINLLGKIGFGNMKEEVAIDGSTTITTPAPNQTVNVIPGPLGGAANSGQFSQNEFAVVPEFGIKFVYAVNECFDLTAGYNYIYWSRMAQAGNQIDPQLDDPPSAFVFRSGSYWVHGFSFGGEYRF